MTNKKSQRNQRRNRKHRTLRGGGLFDGWFGNATTGTEQPVPSSEPKKSWYERWFGAKPAATTMTTNPVAEKKTDDTAEKKTDDTTEKKTDALNAVVTGQPATGGKRRNKTEKNKNKNRKNKH